MHHHDMKQLRQLSLLLPVQHIDSAQHEAKDASQAHDNISVDHTQQPAPYSVAGCENCCHIDAGSLAKRGKAELQDPGQPYEVASQQEGERDAEYETDQHFKQCARHPSSVTGPASSSPLRKSDRASPTVYCLRNEQ
eukprot:4405-Heterococcus_DN1.PRE.5